MSLLPALTPTSLTSHQNPKNQPLSSVPNHQISLQHPLQSVVSWTSSISRHCRAGRLSVAVQEFKRMRLAGVEPNHITFVTLLSGCAEFPLKGRDLGSSIHGYVCKLGLDIDDVMVGTALVEMYAKGERVEVAKLVFDLMKVKNSVSWNTMIGGYIKNREYEKAVEVFDEMPERDVISWTALINGFAKRGFYEEALDWFREMIIFGIEPDYVSIIAALTACANLGTLTVGLWVHRLFLKQSFRNNVRVNNSLIDMYSRCGCIEFAREVFDKMKERTLVSWNSIIVGFAVNGFADEALKFFDAMQIEGFKPDGVSFTGALTACSHAGLVDEGLHYFDIMKRVYRISPRIEHFGCIVDLYSRAGKLKEAWNVVQNMPMKPNEVVLGSLLAACRNHGDINLAERIVKNLVALDPGSDSNYVLLSNIYAAVGRWEGASKVRRRMKALGILKKPGFSSIEIDGCVHEFVASDKSHMEKDCIYATLELLAFDLVSSGYAPGIVAGQLYESD
ncbi:pentatricopeptide repeat-containing protein At1g05750, chloroplastic-like [Hibiscus syriacus]|uniref:pentatricopeptide repeat-containing protein At1g05750, chloroplastic-like n=1 Tax=Hibiscus syriacus TaxID=106335 RepID=UPI001920B087|nr:pentatricopeptide repeat-containing protein At1g05750, chloroplastic-like [Hibiscus syriacus]